jgi:glycosyltransferase involved in cell wall biosynthesis
LDEVLGDSLQTKSAVVPNGWEPTEFRSNLSAERAPSDRLILLFAGKLGGHTDPSRFLTAFTKLLQTSPHWQQKVVLRIVGQKTTAALNALTAFPFQNVLEVLPSVQRTEIARMMQESAALLLLHDWRFERYLPGKIYDYVASKRPVIVLDDRGETRRLVETIGAGWAVDSSDIEGLETILRGLEATRVAAANPARDAWLAEHTRDRLMQGFLSLLSSKPAAHRYS